MKSFVAFSVILSAFLLSGCEKQSCNRSAKEVNSSIKREAGCFAVCFAHDSCMLDDKSRCELDALIVWMKKNPNSSICVAGHASAVGKSAYNKRLSMRRAKSVQSYLSDHGISESRIECKAFGEEKLPAGKGHPKKNRVAIIKKYV
ncbi:OmpA family protein [Candidatus Cytomitobacter indipagum]|uniref:OmpA family protein n=1 Tax=Candidatus Cytomitobacter indipagum TaxID=2601575 RepID=A0A5C0UEI8_9PROT|nr:OmpA family protein [Candidatus Cytomitobacter indipagum]QEK38091.1 OmpA family protein [Candidatus Cytomitobacter indipagum]